MNRPNDKRIFWFLFRSDPGRRAWTPAQQLNFSHAFPAPLSITYSHCEKFFQEFLCTDGLRKTPNIFYAPGNSPAWKEELSLGTEDNKNEYFSLQYHPVDSHTYLFEYKQLPKIITWASSNGWGGRQWWTEVINIWHPSPSVCSLLMVEKHFLVYIILVNKAKL